MYVYPRVIVLGLYQTLLHDKFQEVVQVFGSQI